VDSSGIRSPDRPARSVVAKPTELSRLHSGIVADCFNSIFLSLNLMPDVASCE